MGKPPKKSDNDAPKRCQSCTTRLKLGKAIYHTGNVGKYCEEGKKAKDKNSKGGSPTTGSSISTRTTRSTRRSVSPSKGSDGKGGSPGTMRKEIDHLKNLVQEMSKSQNKPKTSKTVKSAKRKRVSQPEGVDSCAYHYKIQGGRHLFPHGEVDCKLKQSHTEAREGAASAEH